MALGTNLPVWPALLFTYIEPTALLFGLQATFADPATYIRDQLPSTSSSLTPIPAPALALSYQLGNIFLLLALVAVLCTAVTREARVTKGYLAIIALGDLGHMAACYMAVGPEVFWDVGKYNEMMWGNVGFSAFLHVNRVATLLGVFGRVRRL